jgi:SRSO17 transposase
LVGVFLGYASSRGHALIDRRLYLPKTWTSDPARCRQAGVPQPVRLATKPQLAAEMIDDALDAGVPPAPPSRQRHPAPPLTAPEFGGNPSLP